MLIIVCSIPSRCKLEHSAAVDDKSKCICQRWNAGNIDLNILAKF